MMTIPEGDGYVEPIKVKKETPLQRENREAREKAAQNRQKALDAEDLLKRTAAVERSTKQQPTARSGEKSSAKKTTTATAKPSMTQSEGIHLDLASPERSSKEEKSKKTVNAEPNSVSVSDFVQAPHLPDRKLGGTRSPFENEIRNGEIEKAKELWEQSKKSNVTTEEFVAHLKETYNNTKAVVDLYPKRKLSDEQARKAFESDLEKISPHLYKVFRDSFTMENKYAAKPQARTDKDYFDWVEKNPRHLTIPDARNHETPLETAIREDSPEMAKKIFEVADKNNIKPIDLAEPLINNFKKILNPKSGARDEKAANIYAKKVIDALEPANAEALDQFLISYAKLMGA
jgi:hypothetical protein